MTTTHPLRRALVSSALLVSTLAGCGSEDGTSGRGFNDADIEFATEMIQHHAQALQMVDLTLGRELDPAVAELAEEVRSAQTPEIEKLADWLEDWDQPVPETSRDHANAHADDHGGSGTPGGGLPGMMSAEEMARLEAAAAAEFEDLWLAMMIEHHEGAVTMAEREVEEGASDRAVALAERIAAAQEREVATMRELLTD
jgi:uncharacterized protein (DUF305 family)